MKVSSMVLSAGFAPTLQERCLTCHSQGPGRPARPKRKRRQCNKHKYEHEEISLVDDSSADTDLTSEVLARSALPSHIHAVTDGLEAIALLRRVEKYSNALLLDFVILDLSLRNRGVRAVEAEIKADPVRRKILSTSKARQDIVRSYELSKPGNLQDFSSAVTSVGEFLIPFGAFAARG